VRGLLDGYQSGMRGDGQRNWHLSLLVVREWLFWRARTVCTTSVKAEQAMLLMSSPDSPPGAMSPQRLLGRSGLEHEIGVMRKN
jgi:hypothetical protein